VQSAVYRYVIDKSITEVSSLLWSTLMYRS